MALFRYEAADGNGKILRGAMDAQNAQEVSRRLVERGYQSVQVQQGPGATGTAAFAAPTPAAPVPAGSGWALGKAVSPADLGMFFRQMASLLSAGFTPASALADLGMRTRQRQLAHAAREIGHGTERGESMSQNMARFSHLFAPHVVGLVAAGETGGFLPFAFEEAALGAEQDAALRQGLWLPKLLIWQAVWSVLLLQPLFPSLNPDDVLGSFARYGRTLLFVMIPLGVLLHVLAAVAGWWWRQPANRRLRDRLSLRIPVMARVAKTRALASFTRVLRRLLLAGISPEPAFVGAARSAPNLALAERLLAGAALVRSGQGMDVAVQATGMMDSDPVNLLVTGQKTGQWAEMLDRVTQFYQEEAARATDAAKSAQKRIGGIVTLVSMGYVTIVVTHGLATIGFKWTESWTQD